MSRNRSHQTVARLFGGDSTQFDSSRVGKTPHHLTALAMSRAMEKERFARTYDRVSQLIVLVAVSLDQVALGDAQRATFRHEVLE